MKRVAAILAMLALTGCAGTPLAVVGNTGKHTATAVRIGLQDLVSNFALASLTLSSTGTITARLLDFTNRSPIAPAIPTITVSK